MVETPDFATEEQMLQHLYVDTHYVSSVTYLEIVLQATSAELDHSICNVLKDTMDLVVAPEDSLVRVEIMPAAHAKV
jgi:hypothetical protein